MLTILLLSCNRLETLDGNTELLQKCMVTLR